MESKGALIYSTSETYDLSCEHDWRLNPVVVATSDHGDCELWTCAKCKVQRRGPVLRQVVTNPSKSHSVVLSEMPWPMSPETWERRNA